MLAESRSKISTSRIAPEAEEISNFFLACLVRDVLNLKTHESVPGMMQVGLLNKRTWTTVDDMVIST